LNYLQSKIQATPYDVLNQFLISQLYLKWLPSLRIINQPGKQTANNPVTFPMPAFYFFIGNIKTAGGEAAYKMKDNA
jgi:hypothetical protein